MEDLTSRTRGVATTAPVREGMIVLIIPPSKFDGRNAFHLDGIPIFLYKALLMGRRSIVRPI